MEGVNTSTDWYGWWGQVTLGTHNDEEAELLREESLGTVFLGEHELAHGMTSYILLHLQSHGKAVPEPVAVTACAKSGGNA